MKREVDQYQIAKNQSDDMDDLIGRLLYKLLNLQAQGNSNLKVADDNQSGRHAEKIQFENASIEQRDAIQKMLGEIKKTVAEKKIDLSQVVAGLEDIVSSVENGSDKMARRMNDLPFEIPETQRLMTGILEAVRQNKPKDVVFDKLIKSQRDGNIALGKLIATLIKEVRAKELKSEYHAPGEIEILKPKWWKEFSFSWAPLEKLFEKLKSHTFSVKVENQQGEQKMIDSNDLAQKISEELRKVIKSIPRGGGMGNPFSFDGDGNLKISGNVGSADASAFSSSVPTEITLTLANTAYILPASELAGRRLIQVHNISDTDVYYGNADVTVDNGMPLFSSNYMEREMSSGLYACCASAGKKLRILEYK